MRNLSTRSLHGFRVGAIPLACLSRLLVFSEILYLPRTASGWVNVEDFWRAGSTPHLGGSELFRAVSIPPSFVKRFVDVQRDHWVCIFPSR